MDNDVVIFKTYVGHNGGQPVTVTAEFCPISEDCEITEVQADLCGNRDILPYLSGAQVSALETIAFRERRKQQAEEAQHDALITAADRLEDVPY